MKAFFQKILNWLKIIALYIKKIIKKVMTFLTRTVYIFLAIGYIIGLVTVYFSKPYIQEYNKMAIEYTNKASDGFKSVEAIKNIDSIIEEKLKERYKQTEKNVVKAVNQVNEKNLAKELLFGKKIEQTSFVQGIKTEIKNGFKVDVKQEIKSVIKTQKNHPILDFISNLLTSDKIAYMALLLLSFPAFSPVVITLIILGMMSKKYIRYVSSPNEVNYITALPSLYVTNIVLAIVSVIVFYFEQNTALIIAGLAHLLFIWKVFNGIRLKNIGYCLSCGQKFPKEDDLIKEIKSKQ